MLPLNATDLSAALIRCIDTGANASAEEAGEDVEDGAVQVNNVVNSFRLSATQFDKKQYLSHLKGMSNCAGTQLRSSGLMASRLHEVC